MFHCNSVYGRCTYSRKRRLWILSFTVCCMQPVMGEVRPELRGLVPGDSGEMQLGDGWEMGDNSALLGVPVTSPGPPW